MSAEINTQTTNTSPLAPHTYAGKLIAAEGLDGSGKIFCAHHSFLPVPTKKLKPGDAVPRAADILQSLMYSSYPCYFFGTSTFMK